MIRVHVREKTGSSESSQCENPDAEGNKVSVARRGGRSSELDEHR